MNSMNQYYFNCSIIYQSTCNLFIRDPNKIETLWEAYKTICSIFAEKIKNEGLANPKSVIILHDNHLLMFPFYLLLSNKQSYIINVHTQPFPSSDFFMQFPYRLEIARSMMGCAAFSFNSFQAAKHYINVVKKLLEVEAEME